MSSSASDIEIVLDGVDDSASSASSEEFAADPRDTLTSATDSDLPDAEPPEVPFSLPTFPRASLSHPRLVGPPIFQRPPTAGHTKARPLSQRTDAWQWLALSVKKKPDSARANARSLRYCFRLRLTHVLMTGTVQATIPSPRIVWIGAPDRVVRAHKSFNLVVSHEHPVFHCYSNLRVLGSERRSSQHHASTALMPISETLESITLESFLRVVEMAALHIF